MDATLRSYTVDLSIADLDLLSLGTPYLEETKAFHEEHNKQLIQMVVAAS
jgi:hypothetical protein